MSWLLKIVEGIGYSATGDPPVANDEVAKEQIVSQLLNLIEQSRNKSMPLAWLTKEIKEL